ncbi:hypothetical protein HOD38_01910 [archaeon]|jgi:hypothetical protein|nr:hypothetical protein [archaeon]MBT4396998.1 hypothetical protein [archaeon]MBT4440989.1 hypothetical protein [archaeon]
MNFIRKMCEGKHDEDVQQQMKRFSTGNFINKAIVEIKKGKKIKIKTTFEYANWFVKFLAEKGKGKYRVQGGVLSKIDLREELGVEVISYKQFMGVKKMEINADLPKEKILELLNNYPDALMLFTFENDYGKIKTKVKAPKSGKEKPDAEPKVNYCTFVTEDEGFLEEFVFDFTQEFKAAKIKHTFAISNIEVPEEYKNDPKIARMKAIRHGKLIREIEVDGKKEIKEYSF